MCAQDPCVRKFRRGTGASAEAVAEAVSPIHKSNDMNCWMSNLFLSFLRCEKERQLGLVVKNCVNIVGGRQENKAVYQNKNGSTRECGTHEAV